MRERERERRVRPYLALDVLMVVAVFGLTDRITPKKLSLMCVDFQHQRRSHHTTKLEHWKWGGVHNWSPGAGAALCSPSENLILASLLSSFVSQRSNPGNTDPPVTDAGIHGFRGKVLKQRSRNATRPRVHPRLAAHRASRLR